MLWAPVLSPPSLVSTAHPVITTIQVGERRKKDVARGNLSVRLDLETQPEPKQA